jgi:polygalacturonase
MLTAYVTEPDHRAAVSASLGDRLRPASGHRLGGSSPPGHSATFSITDFGAVAGGKTMNTAAIQKTIDACSHAGGGHVVVPAGLFLTGPLTLASGIDLHLDQNATILFDGNLPALPRDSRGYVDFLRANNAHDVSITGAGTIDGQGRFWWPMYKKQPGSPATANEAASSAATQPPVLPHRPFMIALRLCRRVLVSGVHLRNSPMFHLVPERCRDVTIDGVNIQSPFNSPNTDGIDPSGWNFLITGCTIDTGDDCIALKPQALSKAAESLLPAPDSPACEDFLITHCTFLHGHGMSIGNPTPGGARHIVVRDCSFDSTDAGIRLKTQRGKGGVVEDLTYENLTMKNVKVAILITSYYPSIPSDPAIDPSQPADSSTPVWRNIRISNVQAAGGKQAARIIGLPEMPIDTILLDHVKISADLGMQIVHARGIRFVDSHVTAANGPVLNSFDADVTGLDSK